MPYADWIIERWATPISDEDVTMNSLVDDHSSLKIVFAIEDPPDERRWEFQFARVPAYRNILEEYRLDLWRHLDESRQHCGSTFVVRNSAWIAELSRSEALFSEHHPQIQHYVMTTWDDVIEVLTCERPQIREID